MIGDEGAVALGTVPVIQVLAVPPVETGKNYPGPWPCPTDRVGSRLCSATRHSRQRRSRGDIPRAVPGLADAAPHVAIGLPQSLGLARVGLPLLREDPIRIWCTIEAIVALLAAGVVRVESRRAARRADPDPGAPTSKGTPKVLVSVQARPPTCPRLPPAQRETPASLRARAAAIPAAPAPINHHVRLAFDRGPPGQRQQRQGRRKCHELAPVHAGMGCRAPSVSL